MALEQLSKAVVITTQIIDQDISIFTRVANVTKCVRLAPENIYITAAIIEMKMLNTLFTFLSIQRKFTTAANGYRLGTNQ
jgi:hypothetical protein